MLPIGLTVLAFIRPDFSGGASRGGGREAPSQGERSEPGGEQNLFCDPEPRPGEAEDGAANERPARGGRGGKGEPKGSTRAEDSPKGSASPYPRQTNVWRGRLIWRGLGGGITETSPWPLHKNRSPPGENFLPFGKGKIILGLCFLPACCYNKLWKPIKTQRRWPPLSKQDANLEEGKP